MKSKESRLRYLILAPLAEGVTPERCPIALRFLVDHAVPGLGQDEALDHAAL